MTLVAKNPGVSFGEIPLIVHWPVFDRGERFAATDTPDLLIGDIRAFFRRFR